MEFRPKRALRRFVRDHFAPMAEPARPTSCLKLDLSGRTALVTGATGQIGRAISRTLAACGANVAVHYYRSQLRAQALAAELEHLGVRACAVGADVTDHESVEHLRESVARHLGPVDIAIINAVAWHTKTTVLELSVDEFERVYRSCVLQTVNLAKAFAPSMIEQRWGRVIGISSEVAMQALPLTAPYTAGKRGLDGVLRVLTRELGPHQITVNAVAPGWVISDRDRTEASERDIDYEGLVPLHRRGFDQDVANSVAFLSSDLAGFISGVYLPVCGGNVMPAI